ncbi:hypothetical protein Q9L58_005735 [Maublancomyces gigas]|uniref:U6 snRNA-associated Sm-like protein LSm1 n=1 Tax=Discina gigas TaxID=1032678 RepID=A0ABR3GHI7_9PEZI
MEGAEPPTLPPQMFTTSAQLLDLTDKKLLVALRDGRKLIGVLRSWDQASHGKIITTKRLNSSDFFLCLGFTAAANLVLQSTVERLYVNDAYCDIQRGVFIVRGENVLLLGEIDLDREDDIPFRQASVEEVFAGQRLADAEKKHKDKVHRKKLRALGFEDEGEVLV